ncbi:NIPSNAP family protein [Shewanella sediminis]|nr:NIPSNAP family protein [Shewanella sediminis]
MPITCFIQYKINPYKVDLFEQYAKNWGEIIPHYGGDLLGYFMPYEGTSDIAFGLVSFQSLADYERYRDKLRQLPQSVENFELAKAGEFIIEENRSFLRSVEGTYKQAPTSAI